MSVMGIISIKEREYTRRILKIEVDLQLKRMRLKKAVGQDGISVEI